jgi:hypothetical protein
MNLTEHERAFLKRAREKFDANVDWFEFEDFAFGMRSPIYSKQRSHPDVVEHPLYTALKAMWLDLGMRQGRVAATKVDDAARRETTRRR